MTDRKSISTKTRFEIFKRDKFTCQYCGKSAPDVILHVDHIMPLSKGGEDDITNLITACQDCNLGKGARELNDDAVIKKQKQQLDVLQERREQLEMMMEWQRGLLDLDNQATEEAASIWKDLLVSYELNEKGVADLKKLISKFGLAEIIECMKISTRQYLINVDGKYTRESACKAWEYVERIAASRKRLADDPKLQTIYLIISLLQKREFYLDRPCAMDLVRDAIGVGISLNDLKEIVYQSRNWTDWKNTMQEFIDANK